MEEQSALKEITCKEAQERMPFYFDMICWGSIVSEYIKHVRSCVSCKEKYEEREKAQEELNKRLVTHDYA